MKQEIENLYAKTSKETANFTTIEKSVFVKCPKAVRVFRLMAGKDQRSFAKMIGKNQKWLSAIERGFIQSMNEADAQKIANLAGKLRLEKFLPGKISQIEKEIANRGKFAGEYARKMALRGAGNSIKSAQAQKPTEQENAIAAVLQRNNIDFQIHKPINVGKITFVCDFVIGKLPIVIEAKCLTTKYRTKALLMELAYKALRIKRFYPKAKLVAVINRGAKMTQSERLVLEEEFDCLFFDNELERLANEIS